MNSNHKWRVSVYLGKERYEELEIVSNVLKVPMSTLVKIILESGFSFAKLMEGGAFNNGNATEN